jgi:hypothetical protein
MHSTYGLQVGDHMAREPSLPHSRACVAPLGHAPIRRAPAAAAVTVRSQRSWAAEAQTDDSALGHYTYFLDDVKVLNKLIVSTCGRRWKDAPVLLVTGKVSDEAVLTLWSRGRR